MKMLLPDLKSIRSVRKNEFLWLRGEKEVLRKYSETKPQNKRNLVGESYVYVVKNVGKGYWNNIHTFRVVLCITCSR